MDIQFVTDKRTGNLMPVLEAAKRSWLLALDEIGGPAHVNEILAMGGVAVEDIGRLVAPRSPVPGVAEAMRTPEFVEWAKGTLKEHE